MAGKVQLGIDVRLAQPVLDVLALLLGDHGQRPMRLAADFLGEIAVAHRAEHADQHRQREQRQHEAPPRAARRARDPVC
ncbi:hypothetical protein [Thauera humireducens]|uniref:hypothetical protein n=1 Tax=Thauera humireducens TaxID=1134435 RepID=UPI0031202D72